MIRIHVYIFSLMLISCGIDNKAVKKTKTISGTQPENLRTSEPQQESYNAEALASEGEGSPSSTSLPNDLEGTDISLDHLIQSEQELIALENRLVELRASQERNINDFQDQLDRETTERSEIAPSEDIPSQELAQLREQLGTRLDLFRDIFDQLMSETDSDQMSPDKKRSQALTLADSLLSQILHIKEISNHKDGTLDQIASMVEKIKKDLNQLSEPTEEKPDDLMPILEHLEGAAHIALPILKIFI